MLLRWNSHSIPFSGHLMYRFLLAEECKRPQHQVKMLSMHVLCKAAILLVKTDENKERMRVNRTMWASQICNSIRRSTNLFAVVITMFYFSSFNVPPIWPQRYKKKIKECTKVINKITFVRISCCLLSFLWAFTYFIIDNCHFSISHYMIICTSTDRSTFF